MTNYSDEEYQRRLMKKHGSFNPYTVLQRWPSQTFVYDCDAKPLEADLQSIVTSLDSSASVMNRVVVPEVVLHSVYASNSDIDTRSTGNPYAHHPNYTTPSQYFAHLGEETNVSASVSESQLLTIAEIASLPNPFVSNNQKYEIIGERTLITAPNDITLNKNAFTAQSIEDLNKLQESFAYKGGSSNFPIRRSTSAETLNKKLFSSESIYEISKLQVDFEPKDSFELQTNLLRIQEFSPQSLNDLRKLKNLSEYSDFNGPTHGVSTCIGISPASNEVAEFEYFENVQYGGI